MNRDKYGFILSFLLVVFVLSTAGEVSAETLPDIRDKYTQEINYLIDEGIINGYPDGTFGPDNNVTREEAVTMIGRALSLSEIKGESSFGDVDPNSFGAGFIESTYQQKIITGYPNNEFRPANSVTRGEMAVIIARGFDLSATGNYQFTDVKAEDFFAEAVNKLTTAGIAGGTGDGYYKPGDSITREHFSLLLARALNPVFVIDEQKITPIKQVVSATVLNVRSEPSSATSTTVIGQLRKNDVVTATKKSGEWYYVEHGSISGYVHGYYIENRAVAIDAGHGGTDPGASANGLVEKELNLDVAKRVKNYLTNTGIRVEMTRTTDTTLGLNERVDYAVGKDVDTFVSIHGNANSSPYPDGSETFFSNASYNDCTSSVDGIFNARTVDSCNLSDFIQKRLVVALGTDDRGINEKDFRVIYRTPLVSSLVELAFLTNEEDASKLASDNYRQLAAEAIYQGIMDYYKWQEK
ncbi:N-acetylmuramoyl-L-alanine amidase [Virgibacillus sp. DJP39]|uniref:N-acetylmuramoyl-L-alanine amidase n=1 Tax=Virgibacillus sp. DJP39 TaxID=3409790 RepID=UPI003BB5BCA4